MKKRFSKAYFAIPVIYMGIVVVLLFLQFSGGQRFQEYVGNLTLSGRIRNGGDRTVAEPTSIRLSFNGLEFVFDSDSTVGLRRSPDEFQPLELTGFSRTESGFSISFQDDIEIEFAVADTNSGELQIKPVVPRKLLPVQEIRLPFRLAGGADAGLSDIPGVLRIRYKSNTYYLSPPPRSRLLDDHLLVLPGDIGTQTIRYTRATEDSENVVATWFSDDRLSISDQKFNRSVSAFVDAAYAGWREQRFNGGSGTWNMRSGSPLFSEQILTAYLAEAWRRNDYTNAFTDMRRAADQHAGQIGLLSSAFLGNLREIRQQVLAADREESARLLALVRKGDLDVFLKPYLMTFALDRGGEELYNAILDFAERANYRDADMFQTIGMLRCYVEAGSLGAETRQALTRLRGVVDEKILPALIKTTEGFFVETSHGQIDMYHSVLAGKLLEQLGLSEKNPRLVSIGRNIVTSGLSFADDNGFLPAVLYTGNGALQGSDGSIGPEELYRVLADNKWYPHEISLAEKVGRGSWIWSAAPFTTISATPAAYDFVLENVPNRTHYIFMQGIPPFQGMILFGQQWRNDPSFERYIKGRHYNAETRTLMIKYTDGSSRGEIRLQR